MERLTNYGPRPVGSYECDVQAVSLLQESVRSLVTGRSHDNLVTLELDTQTVSGQFFIPGYNIHQKYRGVKNVVVRLFEMSLYRANYM